MPIHVALYARSSNDAHDVSCDSQLREFERLATEAGEVEVARRVDSAVSHFEAKGLLELLQLAKTTSPPPFSKVYVWDTARISRVLYRQAKMMFEFESVGVELHICKLPSSSSMAELNFLRNIHGSVDQYHSDNAALEAKRGMLENIRQGWRAGGVAPYGYRLEHVERGRNRKGELVHKSRLVIDEEQAQIVREVFRRVSGGESYPRIAEDLTHRRVPRARGGAHWNRSAVRAILVNADTYLGHTVWNKTGDRQRRRGRRDVYDRPRDEWIIVRDTHPPIITEELAAKARIKRSPGLRRRVTNPLHGLLYCGHCGHRMHSWGNGRLVCASSARGEGCPLPGTTVKAMVGSIAQALLESVNSPRARHTVAQRFVSLTRDTEKDPLADELQRVQREIGNWEGVVGGAASAEEAQRLYLERLQPLYQERDTLERRRLELLKNKPQEVTLPQARRAVDALFHLLQDINELGNEELAHLFRAFLQRVTVAYESREYHLDIRWLPAVVGFDGGGGGNRTPVR